MRTRAAAPPARCPPSCTPAARLRRPSSTDSGARRRSVGGRIAGAGRAVAFAGNVHISTKYGAAAFQSAHSGDHAPMPSTAMSIAAAHARSPATNARQQLLPPKPNEFDSATRTSRSQRCRARFAVRTPRRDARIERARHEAALHRDQRDHRFDDAGRAERVAGPAFRRTGERCRPETCARRAPLRLHRSACSPCRAG